MLTAAEDLDEDSPPDLSTLASQVAALTGPSIRQASLATSGNQADVSFGKPGCQEAPTSQPMRRGFLNSKSVPHLASKTSGLQRPRGKAITRIPQDFIIPPDEHQLAKDRLLGALKPTQETINNVLSNPALLAGFDDPAVMSAVSQIAADPCKIENYRNQPKVINFYRQMGDLMASRCNAVASAEQQARPENT